ncbi:S41 family peptidase [Psychroserpens sp. NJDZ02]|uniref:S41 family peptidase n=1 Tax=Psychroserpens sp. NJDZ02 TaxID=2570561 RepID=UPI0010A7B766|nr:S41 family peptidase [Psychroserpens sp. NJDZ02]QCE43278.1 peptidase S41 [Psychroserpens sp. NJDZ02]
MRKLFSYLSIILLLVSCNSIETYNLQVTKQHAVQDLHADIDAIYNQLKRNHPHLYQFNSKETLDFKFDSLKMAITTPMDSRTFYKQLAEVTKYVGQGHFSITPPSKRYTKKERDKLNTLKFGLHFLEFEYLDDALFIVDALGQDSVLINAEVLKIENETPQKLIKKYKRIIASDGYNTTFHNRVVGKRFLNYYTNDKGRFDSISLTLKTSDSTFIKKYKRLNTKDSMALGLDTKERLAIVKKDKIKLTKSERKAKKTEAKALSEFNSKYGYTAIPFFPEVKRYNRNLNFVGKDSTVALLKIKSFTRGDYERFYDDAFATLDSLKTKTLIIDLRNNFGGRLPEIAYLYSYLSDQNFTFINKSETKTRLPFLKSMMSNSKPFGVKVLAGVLSPVIAPIEFFKSSKKDGKLYYGLKQAKVSAPKALNFKGKIYVLINGNSFSSSSVLSSKLHGAQRATFVGEETGGAYNGTVAGLMKRYILPNTKVEARIGLLYMDTKQKMSTDGYGVKPDVKITPTYQDRLNNIDPELQWVLEDIEGQK